ncbi:MAG: ferritin-like domain-containing protein [Croceibacterium sp.]
MTSLAGVIRQALLTPHPQAKVMATRSLVRQWRLGKLAFAFDVRMPDQPAWPATLELLPPGRMPKRGRGGSDRNRIALWHSIAHIEFVAIDLALDIAGRFGAEMGRQFVDDFLAVAADEAMHFALAERKLRSMGAQYTCLPAHNGLWDAALATRHDVAARLALVPMVLEARALDATPATLERVQSAGDAGGARILQRILDDEIRHVRFGATHFAAWCENHAVEPESHWKTLVARHFHGAIKPPFNDSARLAAGLSRDWYTAVA